MLQPPFYVISDTHFFHQNIVSFCKRQPQIDRLVESQPHLSYIKAGRWDHNEYMIHRWNSVVRADEPILHLGDVCMRGGLAQYELEVAPRLHGKKYLLLGNHDKGTVRDYERMGFEVIDPFHIEYKGLEVSFDHYPLDPGVLHPEGNQVHVHGHIHNNGYPIEPGPDGWRAGTTEDSPMQINVSVEMVDYTPQSIEALLYPYVRGTESYLRMTKPPHFQRGL